MANGGRGPLSEGHRRLMLGSTPNGGWRRRRCPPRRLAGGVAEPVVPPPVLLVPRLGHQDCAARRRFLLCGVGTPGWERSMKVAIAGVIMGVVVLVSPLHSQAASRAPYRHGLTISVGRGVGAANCKGGPDLATACGLLAHSAGRSVDVFVGHTISSRLAFGLELHGTFTGDRLNADMLLGSAMVAGRFFPMAKSGLHVMGGVGFTVAAASSFDLPGETRSIPESNGSRLGVSGGLGYDIPILRFLAITPTVQATWGPSRAMRQTDSRVTVGQFSFLTTQLGLAVTLR